MKTLTRKPGGVTPTISPQKDPAPAWENPLIPNRRLRELYTAMVELRLLEKHRHPRRSSVGAEACRVSTALSLLPGDLASEATLSPATAFLRGARLSHLASATGQLPAVKDTAARLNLSIGAALASPGKGKLVLAYVQPGELALREWKPILRLAATLNAPILIVVLPAIAKSPGQLSLVSSTCGTPGIPVDAADAVALYRVVQESMLRIRAGGGPVLMECIPFQPTGQKSLPADPILNMRESLLNRKLATESWFTSVQSRFEARLVTAGM